MNRNLFAALLFVAMLGASGQQGAPGGVIRLMCDGKYTDYTNNIRNVANPGGYVEIRGDRVKVLNVLGFEGDYRIANQDEARVCFDHLTNVRMFGCLNRFSGEIQFSKERKGESSTLAETNIGDCRPAKPLF